MTQFYEAYMHHQGPHLQTLINFNPSMDEHYINCNYGMNLYTHSQTSTVAPFKFGNV